MTVSPDVGQGIMPARAVSVRARNGWMLLGLLPGACLEASVNGLAFALRVACVLALLSLLDRVAVRGQRAARTWNLQPLLMAAIALCWLPASLPWWSSTMAAALGWACARQLGRTEGGSAFHPAMIGCAAALVLVAGDPGLPATDTMQPWIAAVFASTGVALAVGHCIRWQLPVAVWVGAAIVALPWLASGLPRPAHETLCAALPVLQIAAFFVATDPSSGCQSPRARWAFGLGVGALCGLAAFGFHDGGRASIGMAGAILLMNAAAPSLDRMLPSARRPVAGAA